ncbi:RICIN domain-containing protein [Streptomyces sp. bgisy084]|uniref:RICIN domain-containing protein n=1 Tax=unclassified Streptomyces TaxID=2593676 RepID=UPI003D724799
MKTRRSTHRHRPVKRRLALMTAATAAAAGLIAGMVSIGSADTGTSDRTSAAARQTAVVNPVHETPPKPLTDVPKSDVRRGMVYRGLKPAPKGDRCAGVFAVSGTKAKLCTHGPDAPPKGVDITKDVAPAVRRTAPAAKLNGGQSSAPSASHARPGGLPALNARTGKAEQPAPAASDSATGAAADDDAKVVCDGDGSSGNRVQVLYVHAPGNDRFAEYVASFKKWAAEADVIYNESAKETGGKRHIRFVTEADCTTNVLNVELSAADVSEFGSTNKALAAKGYDRSDRKYMMFADANVYCGIGTFNGDEQPGKENLSNFGPSYGRTDAGCWNGATPAHELGHNLGAVNNSAPHTSGGGHCVDEWDIMCYSDSPNYPKMQILCPERSGDERLDCGHDDYFNTDPKPDSYLATHWNIANNRFLIAGGGDGTDPDPNPTGTPTPTSTPTPTPTPTPTSTPGPSTGPAVKVTQITANSAVVSWTEVPSASGYTVFLNGRKLADVEGIANRLVGLTPDTSYQIAVATREAGGKTSRPGPVSTFRTLAADGDGGGDQPTRPGTKYVMVNALTGLAADIWGGSTQSGAPAIAGQRNGYANQQWTFKDAGDGAVTVTSAVSGKCLQFHIAVPGQFVTQQSCSGAATQKWRLRSAGDGSYVLQPQGSELALGIGNRPFYGGSLLELQRRNNGGYQKWTLQRAS